MQKYFEPALGGVEGQVVPVARVQQIDLQFEKFSASFMRRMRDEIGLRDPRAAELHTRDMIESLARCFTVTLRLPSQVLQRDKVVASYPATLWDHVKAKLGWKHAVKTVRLTEIVTFPQLDLPSQLSAGMRVYVHDESGLEAFP